MQDDTSRFSNLDGQTIHHFMGCSTLTEYSVMSAYSLAKINPLADPNSVCLLAGEVSAGWGAVMNNPDFRNGCSVAVWGLDTTGLAIV